LSSLWILRPLPLWRPAVHPLVYGFRISKGLFNHGDTPLNVGCEVLGSPSMLGTRPAKPAQDPEVVEEDSNMDDEDADAVSEHDEDAEPSTDPDEWHGIPVIEDPTTINHGLGLNPVGNTLPTPHPAYRNLPRASNTLLDSVQRLNEMISTLRSQELIDASLLLGLGIERRFGTTTNAEPTTFISGPNEIGGKENTSSTDGTIDVVAIVGEGNLTMNDAVGGSVQENLAATVQHLADNLAQERSGPSDQVVISIEAVGKGASCSEAGETSKLATESEDAVIGSSVEDFNPLERVQSHRPSPPLA